MSGPQLTYNPPAPVSLTSVQFFTVLLSAYTPTSTGQCVAYNRCADSANPSGPEQTNAHRLHRVSAKAGQGVSCPHPVSPAKSDIRCCGKCTGASPQCERCEKKGVKCQYIPCSQQKANAASSSSPASQSPVSPPSYPVGHSQYHSPQWQQPDSNVQGYIPDSSGGYATPMDWRKSTHRTPSHHQHFGQQPISISPYGTDYPTTTYSPQGSFHQQPPMTRGGGSATQTQYSQSGYQSQGGYSQTDPVVSSLPYYGVAQSRLPTQMVGPNSS